MYSAYDAVAASFIVLVFLRIFTLLPKLARELKVEMTLPGNLAGPAKGAGPLISIVIPAKDEFKTIEAAAKSILSSSYRNIELILIDDRSQDNTFELMNKVRQTDDRVTVARVRNLPAGWTGKTNALSQGLKLAKGDVYLFSDADAFFGEELIESAFKIFQEKKLDFLSLLPGFRDSGFIEKAIYPHMALGISYFFPLSEVNSPNMKTSALASGCFIMVTRESYTRLGGWEKFKSEITEDIAMSRAAKRLGMKMMVMLAGNQLRTIPFISLKAMVRFWVRTFYGGFNKSASRAAILLTNYSSLTAIFVLFIYYLLGYLFGKPDTVHLYLLVACSITLAGVIGSSSIFLKKYNGEPLYGIYSPIGIMVGAWIAMGLLTNILSGRGVRWRGATYR